MPLKVVYVDDEQDLLELFIEDFSSSIVEVRTFSSPDEAIRDINEKPPDLVFLDYQLPGITGAEIAKVLDPAIPKILITGNLHIAEDGLFTTVLQKPIDFYQVMALIASYEVKKKAS